MAFAGINVSFGYRSIDTVGAVSNMNSARVVSHNMAVAGISNVVAPPYVPGGSQINVVQVYAAAAAWVCVGNPPADPTVDGQRLLVPATTVTNISCQPGDALAWTPVV